MDKDSLSKVPSYMLNETNWALWKMKTVAFARAHKWEKILDGSLRASHFKRKLNSSIKEEELDLKSNDDGDEEIESNDINDKLNDKSKDKVTEVITIHGFTIDKFEEGNRYLSYRLVSTINDSILNEFVNATSGNAFELWEILLSKFESQSTANVRQLLTSLLNMKQGNLATGVYVANAEEIASRLTRIVYDNNYNIIAILASYQMINGLDSRFNLFKESMLADDANIMDSKLCGRKILERSERLQLDIKSNVVKSSGTALQVTSRNDLICNYCKKKNHTEENCFLKFPEKRPLSGVPLPKTVNNKVTTSHNYVLPPTGQPISKKTIKKISQLRSESLANIAECDQRLASALPKTQTNSKKTWFVRSNTSHINHVESGYITFIADSGADVTVKHGNGDGLNDFDPDVSIPLEVADQRKVFTKGRGCITGKIDNIHVAPTFSTSLLSVYQMYSEGKAVLFHPTAGILLADADDMHVSCPNYLSKGFIEGNSFKFKIRTEPNGTIQYDENHINVITTTSTTLSYFQKYFSFLFDDGYQCDQIGRFFGLWATF